MQRKFKHRYRTRSLLAHLFRWESQRRRSCSNAAVFAEGACGGINDLIDVGTLSSPPSCLCCLPSRVSCKVATRRAAVAAAASPAMAGVPHLAEAPTERDGRSGCGSVGRMVARARSDGRSVSRSYEPSSWPCGVGRVVGRSVEQVERMASGREGGRPGRRAVARVGGWAVGRMSRCSCRLDQPTLQRLIGRLGSLVLCDRPKPVSPQCA